MGFLVGLGIFIFSFIIPSYLYAILKKGERRERFFLHFVFVLFIIPVVLFFIAYLFSSSISLLWLIFLALLLNSFYLFKLNRKSGFEVKIRVEHILFLISITFVVLVFFVNFEGLNKGYWDSYITLPAKLMNGDYVEIIDLSGENLYSYTIEGNIFHDLLKKESFGISTKDQRIGAAIFYSIPYLLFDDIGFRMFYSLIGGVIFVLGFLISRKLGFDIFMNYVSGFIFALSPYVLNANRLNPNLLAMAIISFMIYLSILKKKNWLLLGIMLGILGGIRNVALILVPAFVFLFFYDNIRNISNYRKFFGKGLLFVLGAFIMILPVLLWNNFAFGNVLEHPTQYPGLYGFRPTFEHEILGYQFEFNGLLNYPFADDVVRTPHYPFPTFLTLPFLIINSLGILLFSASFYGVLRLWKRRELFWFLILLFLPFYLFLSFQENWEDVKSTFILMILPSLFIFVIFGVNYLKTVLLKRKYKLFIPYILTIILIIVGLNLISNLHFDKDFRWHERFPESKNSTEVFKYEDSLMRDEWNYFHTDESLDEIDDIREILTKGNLLPDYSTVGFNMDSFEDDFNNNNSNRMIDVWRYIY